MEKYFKYKRIEVTIRKSESEEFFDNLIKDGWEIIHYSEKLFQKMSEDIDELYYSIPIEFLSMIIIVGKKQNNFI